MPHGAPVRWSVVTFDTVVVTEDLATYAITRDPVLRDQLAVRHLPLVKFVARKMSSSLPDYVELDDLVSWGSIGLLDAIEKFEPTRGYKFSTYAVTRIRGEILDGLQKMEWAPKQVVSRVRACRRISEALCIELGREPTIVEVAVKMECTVADVRTYLHDGVQTRMKALHSPAEDEEGGTIDVAQEADQEIAAEVVEIRRRVARAAAGLDGRERTVLRLYYGESMTLREIAGFLGISVSSATQIHTRLIERLKERLAAHGAVA
jgi:RNA polymerase sigma factor FliA